MAEEKQTAESTEAEATEDVSLLDQIMQQTKIKESDETFGLAKRGVEVFLNEIIKGSKYEERVEKALVDTVIAEIDAKISKQLDAIMHNEKFQQLESAWRGLKLVVDRTNFRENIELALLYQNISRA